MRVALTTIETESLTKQNSLNPENQTALTAVHHQQNVTENRRPLRVAQRKGALLLGQLRETLIDGPDEIRAHINQGLCD